MDFVPTTVISSQYLDVEHSRALSFDEIGNNENDDGDNNGKGERVHIKSSSLIRLNRTFSVHSQSEQRRSDRINQKMKALQRSVPNANKTDKTSMSDEVISINAPVMVHLNGK
ncbi:hypothetical protein PIB30_011405 [Stylosanthes scabra]|uniref:BHLH domain-containing protein n=1 Tax=Stylosanthes scabra TaxID=79078 RepID=A0ABU6Z2S7_9FABA|nr:hypothetical protein [Stylosanthes scabra]